MSVYGGAQSQERGQRRDRSVVIRMGLRAE